jgi:hypothetical protein
MASTSRDRAGRAVRAALAEADGTDGVEDAETSGTSGEIAVGEADAPTLPASPEGDWRAEVCDVV